VNGGAVWKEWPFLALGVSLVALGALYNGVIVRLLRGFLAARIGRSGHKIAQFPLVSLMINGGHVDTEGDLIFVSRLRLYRGSLSPDDECALQALVRVKLFLVTTIWNSTSKNI
jgi:hypothetical protein